jgi:hypothetical protein
MWRWRNENGETEEEGKTLPPQHHIITSTNTGRTSTLGSG